MTSFFDSVKGSPLTMNLTPSREMPELAEARAILTALLAAVVMQHALLRR